MANTNRGRKRIKPGAGRRMVDGKNCRLADEVRYILRRAAEHDGRVVTIGPLVLFSTETGDAWLLDPSAQLAARLARDGDPEPFQGAAGAAEALLESSGHTEHVRHLSGLGQFTAAPEDFSGAVAVKKIS